MGKRSNGGTCGEEVAKEKKKGPTKENDWEKKIQECWLVGLANLAWDALAHIKP